MPFVVQHLESMQYTGTNGAEVVAWLNGTVSLISDDGETLTLNYCGSEYPVPAGGHVVGNGTLHSFMCGLGAEDYAATFVEIPESVS